jgi:uncharacterized membrane protein YozB (DUF420 family)
MLSLDDLPALNAGLNGLAACLLLAGYAFIRRRHIPAHRACMVSAFVVSSAFLVSYCIYHYHVGDVPFRGRGWVRPLYFTILITHVSLAVTIIPLVLITLWRAITGRFAAHRKIARVTFPLWLYVSVTGVAVYLMLFRWYAAKG